MTEDIKQPIFVEGGRWCKHNIFQSVALVAAFPKLTARELALLDYIASWSEREKALDKDKVDLALSYEEVLCIFNLPPEYKTSAVRILKSLCKRGLISRVNSNNRKGRGKYTYLPNTDKIRTAMKKYLKDNKCDKEP